MSARTERALPEPAPDIAGALNRLLTTVKWVDDDGVLQDLDNNVHLAAAVSQLRGPTPHVQIQRIRQGTQTDPRVSVLWAICRVLNRHTTVEVTPDYFFVPATRARVQRELDLELERVTMRARGQRG
ncbi:hypothetical protein KC207_05385 [Phycicoccus sp. BSK3Z-2]|uniref:Uncharacterized protein n=1 Tax=Phycicoccus avicenniae TaxID=2828860 RepID=A0A941D767_9MICO|nr:hypothetical protein [Phycicoccus avicenniae]MBR7742721.1 hypothetical protein [Phycicoccus avicenniae]